MSEGETKETQLEKLFDEWKKKQSQETVNEQKKTNEATFPDLKKSGGKALYYADGFQNSFCPDGFLTEYDPKQKTILFIAREANISCKVGDDKKLYPELDDTFWMKNIWNTKEPGKPGETYKKYVKHYAEECFGSNQEINIAYMNLNKRGGFGECNPTRLKHYVEMYEGFIQEEIRRIHPNVIICSGTYGTVKNLLTDDIKGVEVWDCYHPIARVKQDANRIQKWTFLGVATSSSI